MDEVDFLLLQKLRANCRLTYRELANAAHLTVTAVHKRIQHLLDSGVIIAFTAKPNIVALKGIGIGTWGTTKAKSVDEVVFKLHECDKIFFVGILSGKFLHLGAVLRDISELQDYSSFIAQTGQMDDLTIGIINAPYQTMPETLKNIDFKILKALHRDARKTIADVADEVGLSAKTVKKSIDRMVDNQLVTFSLDWAPVFENDFCSVFYLYLQDNSDMQSVLQQLSEKFGKNIIYYIAYSNIPQFLTLHMWTKSSREMQIIQNELQKEGFKDIIPRILMTGRYFDCWLDDMIIKKAF